MPNFFESVLLSTSAKICVIAAPGSGKTTQILIPKAHSVLENQSIDPNHVLLLTFSRLSAIDLKEKVKALQRVPRASTVHSFCLAFLLSEDNHDIRKRVECVLLDFEKEALLSDLKLVLPIMNKKRLRKALQDFSAAWATQPHDQTFEESGVRRAFKAAVLKWLEEHEAALMEEIVYYAVDLARKLPAASFIDEPQYIFVDEFQDLNRLEQEFIELLAARSNLLLVVGDPDQSIYSFKYAYPNGIIEFSKRADVQTHRHLVTTRCPKRVLNVANDLLKQSDPTRMDLVQPAPDAEDGEIHFVRRDTPREEFAYLLGSISLRIRSGAVPKSILVLAPRKKLGQEFAEYANANAGRARIPSGVNFAFVAKPEFSDQEQERILLFSLRAKPTSLAHIRAYVGRDEKDHFAQELAELKQRYGTLPAVLQNARVDDWPKKKTRVRALCGRIEQLRTFLAASPTGQSLAALLDELFPHGNEELKHVRQMLDALLEEGDTVETLYAKFLDYIRTVPSPDSTVRVMTLMGSKGLTADHIYILGCNAGNVPGVNRSTHITDQQHKEEQRRLLFVGFTRARKSLTVSYSRHIPFSQAKGLYTKTVRTITRDGEKLGVVGISEFLQDLPGITWE